MSRHDIRHLLDPLTARPVAANEARALLADARHLVETTTADDEALLDAAVLIHESLPATQHEAEPWCLLAEIAYKLGYLSGDDYEPDAVALSLSILERALTMAPGHLESRALRADVLMLARRYKEGAAALDGLDPNHWRAASALARLTEVTRNPLTYRTALRSMVKHAPATRRPTLLNSAGSRLAEVGRYDEALEMLDECLALEPTFAWAWHSKARILAMLGRRGEALALVERAMTHGRFGAAAQLHAWLLTQPELPPRTQILEARCASCSAAVVGGRCPCEARETVSLTPREIQSFRRKPCPSCGFEVLGFATKCAACHARV
ncbi:MAG: tetratricopeptide repeat protein [Deltaproteobacteria bacterium]|nr:tetratricopeptide repeat protein [Deltaproteobacteria bacterium]